VEREPGARPRQREKRPWNPLSVTIITFFLPPGGAVLTILNLSRMSALERPRTRELSVAVIIVFALGFSALLALSQHGSKEAPRLDSVAGAVIQLGCAVAALIAQRTPFRDWRSSHAGVRTDAWLPAAALAVAYSFVTAIAAAPMYALLSTVVGTGVGGSLPT
jgi:hypothetical protein